MILVDTNVLVAATNPTDRNQRVAAELLRSASEPLLVPSTVVAEACYLIDRYLGSAAEARFLRAFGAGDLRFIELNSADLDRMAELVDKYGDLRLGGTDASLVAVAERLGVSTVATFDRRHFTVVRRHT